jgi:hypothetical protein
MHSVVRSIIIPRLGTTVSYDMLAAVFPAAATGGFLDLASGMVRCAPGRYVTSVTPSRELRAITTPATAAAARYGSAVVHPTRSAFPTPNIPA